MTKTICDIVDRAQAPAPWSEGDNIPWDEPEFSERMLAEHLSQEHDLALRRSWAQLIKRVYEVDPLLCPKCGGEMRIIAFITDHDVVDAILRHLAKAEARSPRGPPSAAALSAAS